MFIIILIPYHLKSLHTWISYGFVAPAVNLVSVSNQKILWRVVTAPILPQAKWTRIWCHRICWTPRQGKHYARLVSVCKGKTQSAFSLGKGLLLQKRLGILMTRGKRVPRASAIKYALPSNWSLLRIYVSQGKKYSTGYINLLEHKSSSCRVHDIG